MEELYRGADDEDSREINLPALGETDLDDPNTSSDRETDNSEQPRTYQDDLDYEDTATDPIAEELTDSPAEELGIPEDEYRDELNKYADDGTEVIDDDMREDLEDREENDDNPASNP